MLKAFPARRPLLAAAIAAAAVGGTAALSSAANPAAGTTDGGQTLNVAITSPADGAVFPAGTTSVPLTGQVSLGDVPITGEAHVAVAMDESGSMSAASFSQEKTAANTLHMDLEDVEGLNVFSSAIFFSSGAQTVHADSPVDTDVSPANGTPDFRDKVSARAQLGGGTNFQAAITNALAQLTGKPGVKLVFFISDGQPSTDVTPAQIAALNAQSIAVHTYALGNAVVPCENPSSRLKALSDATGGTCTTVTNPNDLDAALTGTTPAGIDLVESRANGDPFTQVDTFGGLGNVSDTVGGLVPGANTIELRATASDQSETQVTADIGVTVRVPVVAVEPASGGEGDGTITHRVTLDHAAVAPVSAQVSTADVSATDGADYTGISTTVTFQPGETEQFVDVPVLQDGLDEPDETYTIGAGNVSLGGSGAPAVTGTIVDDDEPTLGISDDSVVEGNPGDDRRLQHAVTLSGPSTSTITANVALVDGTAVAGEDMEPLASGTVTFAPGETSKTVEVLVREDLAGEDDEQYTVTLTSDDVAVTDGSATGTIINDDRVGTFSCRATALRLGTTELITANAPLTPCRPQDNALLPLPVIGTSLLGVGGGVATAQTTSNVGQEVKPGDQVSAVSRVVGLRVRVGTLTITADVLESIVTTRCGTAPTPTTTTGGRIANLRINGAPASTSSGSGPVTIPLGLVTIRLNAVSSSKGITTRRALEITGLLGTIVVSEARAGSSGPVCEPPLEPAR